MNFSFLFWKLVLVTSKGSNTRPDTSFTQGYDSKSYQAQLVVWDGGVLSHAAHGHDDVAHYVHTGKVR